MKAVNLSNKTARERIQMKLDEVQKGCSARTITFDDIVTALYRVTVKLDIHKKDIDGTTVTIDVYADDFPRAYKYIPYSTIFDAEYRNGHWYVTNIYRGKTHAKGRAVYMILSESAKTAVLDNFNNFDI